MEELIREAQRRFYRLFPDHIGNIDAEELYRVLRQLGFMVQSGSFSADTSKFEDENGMFYCMAMDRNERPKFIHRNIESAVTEAKRLHELVSNSPVQILQIVGEVKSIEVPVTRKEMRVFIKPKHQTSEDDLPF